MSVETLLGSLCSVDIFQDSLFVFNKRQYLL